MTTHRQEAVPLCLSIVIIVKRRKDSPVERSTCCAKEEEEKKEGFWFLEREGGCLFPRFRDPLFLLPYKYISKGVLPQKLFTKIQQRETLVL